MFTDQKTITKLDNQLSSKIDDEVVLLSIDEGKYFKMNDVGSSIWERLDEPRSFKELITYLLEEYEVEEEACREEANTFIEMLLTHNLVSVV